VSWIKSLLGEGLLYRLYRRRIMKQITGLVTPAHVAMILDGNRRWAKLRALATSSQGHRAGADKIQEFLTWCEEQGVSVVTLYLLSTDNLSGRDKGELDDLVEIIEGLADQLSRFSNWRIKHVGDGAVLPPALLHTLQGAAQRSAKNSGMHINLAVGYGGRAEITQAVRRLVESHREKGGNLDDLAKSISVRAIADHLDTVGQPDPDLVIRTSGEQRLSDFMLWQSAHSEFYFVEALGPDLREIDFLRALRDFGRRQRRYGQ
jgi:short-chain Z-isoprenyl diphosphate synthase